MRLLIVVAVFVAGYPAFVFSQWKDPNLQAMVDAERAFILMAKEQNTRDAFLKFLSDEAVTVGPSGPVTGKAALKKQPINPGWLSWEVTYCDIASSGDFGYNTGPWEFRTEKTDEKPSAYGEFHSIWKKQPDGSWKNILDIGIHHGEPIVKEELRTTAKPLQAPVTKTPAANAILSLMAEENAFLAAYRKSGLAAYKNFASEEIRYARQGELPVVTPKEKTQFLKGYNPYVNPELMDGGIAPSGDLGYVYGMADAVVMIDGRQETIRPTYLRIWKKEDGQHWKIVLDVMTYE